MKVDDQKRLDLETWSGKRLPNKKHTPLVTIVTAIVSRGSIIMASDSRTTDEDFKIRDDTKKIYAIHLYGGFGFLIGQSGHDNFGARAVEILAELAKGTTIKDYRTCAELAEEAVRQLKQQIRAQFQGTAEETHRHFENHNFDLLIAHYFKDAEKHGRKVAAMPHIFTLRFSDGIARTRRDRVVSIGCGGPLADFILDGFDVSSFNFLEAISAGIYTVKQVMNFDPRCGGPIQIATTDKNSVIGTNASASEIGREMINDCEKAITEVTAEFRGQQRQMMHGAMKRAQASMSARMQKMIEETGAVSIDAAGNFIPSNVFEELTEDVDSKKDGIS